MNIRTKAATLCSQSERNGSVSICTGVWLISRNEAEFHQKKHNIYRDQDLSSAPYWIQIVDADLIPVCGPEDTDLLMFLESVEELGWFL